MDNQYNQQTNGDPYQQGNGYQQGDPYQQGNGYQQGNPYQQGNGYQQGNAYQQGNGYQQGNAYQQGNYYQQENYYQQGGMGNGYGNYSGGGNTESQKAPNIFQQFALAFVPTQYERLTRVKTGSMIGFVTLLVLTATLLSFIFLMFSIGSIDMKELAEQMPDFTLKNGRMYIDEDFLYDEGYIFVYMTEDIDGFSYEDAADLAAEGYQDVLLVGRESISIMQDGQYQQADFSDFGESLEIDREWIASMFVPLFVVVLIIIYIVIFLGMGLGYFLFAAVYLLFAMLIAAVMKKNLDTGALFRTAVYAKVLMFTVATVLDLIPFVNLSVPFLLRVAITLGFMGFAIAKLPSQNNQMQAPMMMGQGGQGW